jgi:Xaa-Pro dipeptidase
MSKEIFQKNIIYGEILLWDETTNPSEFLRRIVKNNTDTKIAIDDKMWSAHLLSIQEICPRAKFVKVSEVMLDLRLIKDDEEIKKLEKIADITEKVIEKIINEVTVGMTEKQLSTRIEFLFKELGADGISFLPLVASGANAAIPHHIPSNKKIQKGEFVIFDIGGILEGYRSDITRTICLGEPTDEMKKVYEIVKKAHETACKEVSPGKKCFEIDKAARDVIENMNYGEYFTHRTGHGIGLDFHEPPFLLDNNERPIEPGMVFSIEPGIYLSEKFGARIEDIGVVTVNGFKILTNFTRELIIK